MKTIGRAARVLLVVVCVSLLSGAVGLGGITVGPMSPLEKRVDPGDPDRMPGGVAFIKPASLPVGWSLCGLTTQVAGTNVNLDVCLKDSKGLTHSGRYSAPVWIVKPMADVVASPHDALIDLHYGPQMHVALERTVLGLRLFQADAQLLIDADSAVSIPVSFDDVPIRAKYEPQLQRVKAQEKALYRKLADDRSSSENLFDALSSLWNEQEKIASDMNRSLVAEVKKGVPILAPTEQVRPTTVAERKSLVAAQSAYESTSATYTICDCFTPLGMSISAGQVKFSGGPRWHLWDPPTFLDDDPKPQYFDAQSDLVTAAMRKARAGNELVYQALLGASRTSALLRLIAKEAPEQLQELRTKLAPIDVRDTRLPALIESE
jgi:hypothetical protein